MLTQIEIDGFKTFKDFKVELAPFQVIVGANGSGKSNLFDALQLLSRLANNDLVTSFQGVRGATDELFTKLPGGKIVDRMHLAVEMLVDPKVLDDYGTQIDLKYSRLRYELEIVRRGRTGLEIIYESLHSILRHEDSWYKKYISSLWPIKLAEGQLHFITTDIVATAMAHSIIILQAENGERTKKVDARRSRRTVLSGVSDTDYPHVLAARKELSSLRFLHLDPEALRQSSTINAPSALSSEGRYLPSTLARMEVESEFALTDVSRDMANLVPGILKIGVEKNATASEYDIWAETSDQRAFSAHGLSDGTLRLLALATLRNDPQFHGVLCLEEPENGVHPLHLENMTRLLRDMVTDFNDPQQANEPLRQVLITTHSPLFISLPAVLDALLLAIMPIRTQGKGSPALQVTRMVPVITPNTLPQPGSDEADRDKAAEIYTLDTVRKYLGSNELDNARNQLKKARITLI